MGRIRRVKGGKTAVRQVVCLAGEPWSGIPTRTQQLMARMRGANVLFFEPSARRGDRSWKAPGRKLRPDLIAFTLPPEVTSATAPAFLTRRSVARTADFIQAKLDFHHFDDPVLWFATPVQARLVDELPSRGIVYDCSHDWSSLTQTWEADLAGAADVVFASSPLLARRMAAYNTNVSLLPEGCNYPMFARDDLALPRDLEDIRPPLLGYAGTLWPDLDLTPLLELASARPHCSLVLVGRDAGCRMLPQLLRFPNVHYVGEVETVDLPDYLCNFHVSLSLLRQSELESDVIHIRTFECLSAGKPMVAMLREDQVEHFPDVVYGAHTPAEFVRMCDSALEERGRYARDRRRAYGEANSWSNRAEQVNRILESIGLF